MSDYNIKIHVRNNRILKRIRDQYGSSAKMCRETGMRETAVSALLCFREKPFLQDGSMSATAQDLCSALRATPEELWPNDMANILAKKATYETEISQAEALALCSDSEKDVMVRQLISKWSECLSDRQKIAVEALMAGTTAVELGRELGVCGARAQQIQLKALRKMRLHAVMDDNIRTYQEAMGE